MSQRLVIDLDACRECAECTATCGYPYRGENNGVARLRESAGFELTCRKCEVRSCVEACPNEALEKQDNDVLKRYNMRCTGCLSCSMACPFGNIIPAAFEFKDAACDYCAGRSNGAPECVRTCPQKALVIEKIEAEQPGLYLVGERLAVRSNVWQKKEPAGKK